MENFETKTPDTEQEKQKNNPDFDIMKVNQKEGQDTVKLDPKEMEKFKKFIESSDKLDDYEKNYFTSRLEGLSDEISTLNSRIDEMMDVTLLDNGEVDIDDGQDTAFLQEQVKKINSEINELIGQLSEKGVDMISKIDSLFSGIDSSAEKNLSVEKLKDFLARKEEEKKQILENKGNMPKLGELLLGKKTMKNIEKRNNYSQLLEGGPKVKF